MSESRTSSDRLGWETSNLRAGHYAKKQLFCRSAIIAWSHRSRFRLARKLVDPYAGGNLLDYGCGDGTFLAGVHDLFPVAVGADIDHGQNLECGTRLATLSNISFLLTNELTDPIHESAYRVVTCMEVLEHCIEEDLNQVVSDLWRLVSPDGVVIISVPVEVGPSLIGKQLLRMFASWRGLGDYGDSERYSSRELGRMLFAGEHTVIYRPVYSDGPCSSRYHSHKGFNWRALRGRLGEYFDVKETYFSPLGCLRGYFSSQAWFVCASRKR